MRQFNRFKGTKGFLSTWERVLRFRDMITKEALRRAETLAFWEKHGLEATMDAFKTKRRTLFSWKKKLREGGGKFESLNPRSKAPRNKRKRSWDYRILEEIRRLRDIEQHPNLGKDKLYSELKTFCDSLGLTCPKPRTIGRLIKDLGGLRVYPQKVSYFGKIKPIKKKPVTRKPKDFKAQYPDHCVGLDTIEEIIQGRRRYVITAEDIFGRFAFAWATKSHASKAAQEFFDVFLLLFPYPVTFVLTDNGSEFKKHFTARLLELQIAHYHTYPKTPKMNAHVERFNRTIQDEFLNYHKNLLLEPDEFNAKLMDWLIWYNTKRVHFAFGNKMTPVQFLSSWRPTKQVMSILPAECKSGWPHTLNLHSTKFVLSLPI